MSKSFVLTRTIRVYFHAQSMKDAKKNVEEIDLTELSDDNARYKDHIIEDVLTCEDTGDEELL